MIYLDSAATTLHKPPKVAEAVAQALDSFGNPGRSAHDPALFAARAVYDARQQVAAILGAEGPETIAFAMNATDALNTAIGGLIGPGDHAVTTVCEHNSVLRPLFRQEERGARLTIVPADELGRVRMDALADALKNDAKAIIIGHASNVTGNVVDLARASALAHDAGALLIVDAAQTAGALPIDVQALGVDVLCFTGHKGLLGPQGTGGLYVRPGLTLPAARVGGSGHHSFDRRHPADMPEALEAGTQNAHGLAGLAAGVRYIKEAGVEAIHAHEAQLALRFANRVCEAPDVRLYGDMGAKVRVPIVSLNIGNADAAEVCAALWDEYAICVRGGAHCAPLLHRHFGTEEQGMVRFSFSWANTMDEADQAADAVCRLAEEWA